MEVETKLPAVVRPFRFVLLLTVGIIMVETLFRLALAAGAPDLPAVRANLFSSGPFSIGAAALLTWLGWWRASGLVRAASLRDIGRCWPLLLFALLPLAAGIPGLPANIATTNREVALIVGLLTAFWKVALLGMFVVALRHRGPWRSTLVIAALFGVLHLDGVLVGAPIAQTALLGLSYALLAFTFAALRLCTGVCWPQFVIYALFLVLGALVLPTSTPWRGFSPDALAGRVVITAILALYSAIIMRRTAAIAP